MNSALTRGFGGLWAGLVDPAPGSGQKGPEDEPVTEGEAHMPVPSYD